MATPSLTKLLPTRLWIGTYEFYLMSVPRTHPKLDGDADGITYTGDDGNLICIASHLDARRMLEVVLHEVTHAINWVNDIEDGTDEEDVATKHGHAWSALLLDNPRFQRWLTVALNRIRKERTKA
jgi:hypothetical protein